MFYLDAQKAGCSELFIMIQACTLVITSENGYSESKWSLCYRYGSTNTSEYCGLPNRMSMVAENAKNVLTLLLLDS